MRKENNLVFAVNFLSIEAMSLVFSQVLLLAFKKRACLKVTLSLTILLNGFCCFHENAYAQLPIPTLTSLGIVKTRFWWPGSNDVILADSAIDACTKLTNYFNTGMEAVVYTSPYVYTDPSLAVGESYQLLGAATCKGNMAGHGETVIGNIFATCYDDIYSVPPGTTPVVDGASLKCMCPPGSFRSIEIIGSSDSLIEGKCITAPDVTDDVSVVAADCDCDGSEPRFGEPIAPGTGNMWHVEIDFPKASSAGLELRRTYNSSNLNAENRGQHLFGSNWITKFDVQIRQENPSSITGNSRGIVCRKRDDIEYVWCEPPPKFGPVALPTAVSILRSTGKRIYFELADGVWVSDASVNGRLVAIYNAANSAVTGWTYTAANDGVTERFDEKGRLVSISTRGGMTQRLTYSSGTSNNTSVSKQPSDAPICSNVQAGNVLNAGKLLCVTDQWGHQLQFEYDLKERVVKLIDPSGQRYSYEYDGPSGGCTVNDSANPSCTANNLTRITFPDQKSRTYVYREAGFVSDWVTCFPSVPAEASYAFLNMLTGLVDENGTRYISWKYDCMGNAASSELADGANKVEINYSKEQGASVSEYTGVKSIAKISEISLTYERVRNQQKSSMVVQSCLGCGQFKSRLYDENGNLSQTTDWNDVQTTYEFDLARNLEIGRTEADGTPNARNISTEWHANYRLPARVAEPKKITTFEYYANGNLKSKTEQSTSDLTGGDTFSAIKIGKPRIWSYTWNEIGQIKTVTDPNLNVTNYNYDASGNLWTVTNALKHVTTLSNYDANGHVGKIVDPNNLVTTLTYWPRGWLKSRTVGTQTTSYDYDGVGQLKKITLPDASFITYVYDNAHRLTDIRDSSGNSIHYTLDLTGNRIKEEVKDTLGNLSRQVARQFDSLNRLQQVTGGAQ